MSLFDLHSSVVEKKQANNITTFILLPKHISVYVWSNSRQLLLMPAGRVNHNTLVNSGYSYINVKSQIQTVYLYASISFYIFSEPQLILHRCTSAYDTVLFLVYVPN